MRRRVAITGLGVVSALGGDAAATWAGLVDGRVGIGPLTLFDAADERTGTAAGCRAASCLPCAPLSRRWATRGSDRAIWRRRGSWSAVAAGRFWEPKITSPPGCGPGRGTRRG